MTAKAQGVNARMLQAMGAIDRIAKSGHNDFHNYDYASSEDVKAAVRAALIDAGVMVHTSTTGSDIQLKPGNDGKTAIMAVAWGTLAFVNADDAQDIIVNEWRGLAVDTSDKALSKAITSGVKYALLNSLVIPTGGDPDADSPAMPQGDPGPTEQPAQRRQAPVTHSDAQRPAPSNEGGWTVTDDMDQCPKHQRKWKLGSYGYFCSAKDPNGNERGYCVLHPTKAWSQRHEQ